MRDWATLRQAALQGYYDGIFCLASIEVVERSNRPEVVNPLRESGANRAAKLLIGSAVYQLHMLVARAFAPARHEDDFHLRAAINFLKALGRLDDEKRWLQQTEQQADFVKAVCLFEKLEVDERIKRLSHVRNKQLAHIARLDENAPLPCYDDLFGCARTLVAIWERLSFGAGTIMVPIDYQIDAYRESAEAFWSKWHRSSTE